MTRLWAIAELRFREGLAAGVTWLVPVAFAVGVGAASWAMGPETVRVALADRIVLWTSWGLAFLVAAVLPTLGLSGDVRSGAAQTLLASPVSRFETLVGGMLGYSALSSLLLVAMAGASVLGMEAAGLGAAAREPLRRAYRAELVDAAANGTVTVSEEDPAVAFRFRIPRDLRVDDTLRIRLSPHRQIESRWESSTFAILSLGRPGAPEMTRREVRFKAGSPFTVHLPLGALLPGDDAELVLHRMSGGWSLLFGPDSVEVGGGRALFALNLVLAALCAAPLLLAMVAVGSFGAARFGAPTAALVALFVFVLFLGQDIVLDAAQFVIEVGEEQARAPVGEPADRGRDLPKSFERTHEHEHEPSATPTPVRVALARGAVAVLSLVPRLDVFDRTAALVERRAVSWREVGQAAISGLGPCLALTAAGWLLLRRREIAPG